VSAPTDAVLLRIAVGEEDRYGGRPLFEALVEIALKSRMAGATALRCPGGFGRSRYVRTELNIDAGSRMPMIVEIVDTPEKIEAFLAMIDPMVESGLVTLERVRAAHYSRQRVLDTTKPSSTSI
jgi:uncharacterized protein